MASSLCDAVPGPFGLGTSQYVNFFRGSWCLRISSLEVGCRGSDQGTSRAVPSHDHISLLAQQTLVRRSSRSSIWWTVWLFFPFGGTSYQCPWMGDCFMTQVHWVCTRAGYCQILSCGALQGIPSQYTDLCISRWSIFSFWHIDREIDLPSFLCWSSWYFCFSSSVFLNVALCQFSTLQSFRGSFGLNVQRRWLLFWGWTWPLCSGFSQEILVSLFCCFSFERRTIFWCCVPLRGEGMMIMLFILTEWLTHGMLLFCNLPGSCRRLFLWLRVRLDNSRLSSAVCHI